MSKPKDFLTVLTGMLSAAGLWPSDLLEVSKFWKYTYGIHCKFSFLLFTSYSLSFFYAFVSDLGVSESQATEEFSRIIFVIIITLKMIIVRSDKMKEMIVLLLSEEREILINKNEIIKNIHQYHVGYCRKMVFGVGFFLYAAGFSNIINGLLELKGWHENCFSKSSTTKPHLVPLRYVFDKDRYYIAAISYEVYHILHTLIVNGSIQALINSVLVFLRAELKILQYHVRHFDTIHTDFGTGENPHINDAATNLLKLVKRHQNLIKWVKDLDGSFKGILLLEYCVTSFQLATTLIQILEKVHRAFNGAFFLHCILQLFALAWNANEILLESSIGMRRALYESNWYFHDKKIGFIINFMMMRCLRPLSIHIGPFGNMDLDAAVSRAKLAYTCISVLNISNE